MKLTKRGEYALRALIDMVLAREAGRELIPLKEISAREKIPLPFLEQIFVQLREAGIVDGKRGKHGNGKVGGRCGPPLPGPLGRETL